MSYRRADIVTVALQGGLGKPRPALVIQADWVVGPETLLVVLMTSDIQELALYRYTIEPTAKNGLRQVSQVQIDKIVAAPLSRIGRAIGRLTPEQMIEVDRMLAAVIGLVDG